MTGDILRVGQSTFELDVVPPRAARTEPEMPAPRSAPTVAEMPAPVPDSVPELRVTAGPREGEEIPLGQELLIGRSYGEPGALGGDRRLSRRHARIARGPGGVFFIEDTGSSNGTLVNRTPLLRPRALRDGDEIEIGSSTLVAHGFPAVSVGVEAAESMPVAPAAAAPPPPPATPQAPAAAAPPPPGAAPQFQPQGAAGARLSSRRGRVVGLFAAVFAASVVIAIAVVVVAAPLGSRTCPGGFVCNPPPTTPPLHATASFTGSLGWSVEYDPKSAHPSVANASSNQLVLQETSAYDEHSLGVAANTKMIGVFVRAYRSAETSPTAAENSLANELSGHLLATTTAPDSDQFFTRPALGFHPAAGEVLEGNTQTPQGPGPLVKVAVMSAASGGVTLAVGIVYPLRRGETQSENPNRVPDAFGDEILGTVRYPGDGAA